MPLSLFEKQIGFLRRHREIISLDELYEAIASGRGGDPRQVVLTFDDGYRNNARVVAPMLKAYGLPFAIFISTRHISEGRRFATYCIRAAVFYAEKKSIYMPGMQQGFDLTSRESRRAASAAITAAAKKAPQALLDQIVAECIGHVPADLWAELNACFSSDEPMSWQEVVATHHMGATIGSHCHDHCILHANQPAGQAFSQLQKSKELIEKYVAECRYLAYPNGTTADISPEAYSAAKAAGYRMSFSTIEGEIIPEVDCHFAPRISADPDYEEFCYSLSRTGKQNEYYHVASEAMRTAA
jgi:peptidoglycan/xylan/chitin deacetylase (PgdA/CDA1 family)